MIFKIMTMKRYQAETLILDRFSSWEAWSGVYRNKSLESAIKKFNRNFRTYKKKYMFAVFKQIPAQRNGRESFKWEFVRLI